MDKYYGELYDKLRDKIRPFIKENDCELEDLAYTIGRKSVQYVTPTKEQAGLLKAVMEGLPLKYTFHSFAIWYKVENDIIYDYKVFDDAILDMAKAVKGLKMYDMTIGQDVTGAKAVIRGVSRSVSTPWYEIEFSGDGPSVVGFHEFEPGIKIRGIDEVLTAITQFDKAEGEPPDEVVVPVVEKKAEETKIEVKPEVKTAWLTDEEADAVEKVVTGLLTQARQNLAITEKQENSQIVHIG